EIATPVLQWLVTTFADGWELRRPGLEPAIGILESVERNLSVDVREAVLVLGTATSDARLRELSGVPPPPELLGLICSALVGLGFLRWLWRDGVSAFWLFGLLYLGALFAWLWRDARL